MAGSDIVRRVIIQTEIEHARGTGGPAAGGGRSGSRSGGGSSGTRHLNRERQLTAEVTKRNRIVTNHAKMLERTHKRNLSLIRSEVGMRLESRRNAEREARVRTREAETRLRLERQRTQEILRQARAQDSLSQSPRLQRIRGQVEQELAYRRDTGQTRTIGRNPNRERGFDTRGDYFSTGIPLLDDFNQKGFQFFITVMSARMVLEGTAAINDVTFDFAEGKKGTFGGDVRGLYNRIRDPLNRLGDAEKEITPDGFVDSWMKRAERSRRFVINNVPRLLSGQWQSPDIIKAPLDLGEEITVNQGGARTKGFRARRTSMVGVPQTENTALNKYISGLEKQQGEIEKLYSMAERRMTAEMRAEDEMIRQKRQWFREEMDVLRQRVAAAQKEVDASMDRREQAIQQFGVMTAEDQQRTRNIVGQLEGGANPSTLSREDLKFMQKNMAIFGQILEVFAHNSAFRGGVQDILNARTLGGGRGSINSQLFQDQGELNRDRRDLSDIARDSIFKAELNIERINLETKELVDELNDRLAPEWEKMFRALEIELKKFINTEERRRRTGREIGP